jgi:hypothetical protein
VLKFFDSQKKILIFIKSFVEKKNSLRKKEKKTYPHPKTKSLLLIPSNKTFFERGEIIPSSPLHPIKPLLEK